MRILALEKEKKEISAEQFQPYLIEEAQMVWRLQQADIIREIYFDAENHTAVIVFETESLQMAAEILQRLPLVKAELIDFVLIPLKPYDGYERLFR